MNIEKYIAEQIKNQKQQKQERKIFVKQKQNELKQKLNEKLKKLEAEVEQNNDLSSFVSSILLSLRKIHKTKNLLLTEKQKMITKQSEDEEYQFYLDNLLYNNKQSLIAEEAISKVLKNVMMLYTPAEKNTKTLDNLEKIIDIGLKDSNLKPVEKEALLEIVLKHVNGF